MKPLTFRAWLAAFPISGRCYLACFSVLCSPSASAPAQSMIVKIDMAAPGKAISPDLVGVFFEDLGHAADGGLHARRTCSLCSA